MIRPNENHLLAVAALLRGGKIQHEVGAPENVACFDMGVTCNAASQDCGTVACIGGWAYLLANPNDQGGAAAWVEDAQHGEYHSLFYPPKHLNYNEITPAEAADAIENFVHVGNPDWMSVIKPRLDMAQFVAGFFASNYIGDAKYRDTPETPTDDHLRKLAALLRAGELEHGVRDPDDTRYIKGGNFHMNTGCTEHECGTVACIGGWQFLLANPQCEPGQAHDWVMKHRRNLEHGDEGLPALFYPFEIGSGGNDWNSITPLHAAKAIENYLENGKPRWREVMGLPVEA